jgi:hypothetical protein
MAAIKRFDPRLAGCAAVFWIGTSHAAGTPAGECSPATQTRIYSELFASDQGLRQRFAEVHRTHDQALLDKFGVEMFEQDKKHQAILDEVVAKCGWPESEPFVNGNLEAAFYVIQHAPLAYMERYKDRIEKSHAEGKIPKHNMDIFRERLEFRKAQQKQAVPHD